MISPAISPSSVLALAVAVTGERECSLPLFPSAALSCLLPGLSGGPVAGRGFRASSRGSPGHPVIICGTQYQSPRPMLKYPNAQIVCQDPLRNSADENVGNVGNMNPHRSVPSNAYQHGIGELSDVRIQ